MRKVSFLFVLICFCLKLQAQPYFDVASIQYQYSPDASITGKEKNPLAIHYLQGYLNIPLKIHKVDKLLINPVFEMTELDFKNKVTNDIHLYGLALAISYLKQWKNPKWKTAFAAIGRLSSDFRNLSTKHFEPGGAILVIHERSKKLKIKFGAFYSSEFFGAFVLPLVGADWIINKRLIFHGVFPRNLVLEYKITPRVYAGINWRGITNSYRYLGYSTNDYFKLEENQLHLFADFYLAKHFVLNIEAGHTFLRRFNQRGELQKLAGLDADLTVNEGMLFKAGIYYRIRLDGDNK